MASEYLVDTNILLRLSQRSDPHYAAPSYEGFLIVVA
jgi:hypothetical protein